MPGRPVRRTGVVAGVGAYVVANGQNFRQRDYGDVQNLANKDRVSNPDGTRFTAAGSGVQKMFSVCCRTTAMPFVAVPLIWATPFGVRVPSSSTLKMDTCDNVPLL